MTADELQQMAEEVLHEVARFRMLPPRARRRLAPLESMFDSWEQAALAVGLFLASEPPPDHEGFESSPLKAMRDSIPLLRHQLDKVAPERKDRN